MLATQQAEERRVAFLFSSVALRLNMMIAAGEESITTEVIEGAAVFLKGTIEAMASGNPFREMNSSPVEDFVRKNPTEVVFAVNTLRFIAVNPRGVSRHDVCWLYYLMSELADRTTQHTLDVVA